MGFKNNKIVLPHEIYITQLKKINAVALSQREIDIIACILSGRSAKGTAHFLSISFRTVQVHTYNAMKKLECTSRESMIALIEKSDQFILLKEYYISLLTYSTFQKCLKEVAKLRNDHELTCLIVYWQKNESSFFNHLRAHLTLAGISVLLEGREKDQPFSQLIQEAPRDTYTIYAISPLLLNELQELGNGIITQLSQDARERLSNILLLLPELEYPKDIPKDFYGVNYINTNEQKNYYLLVFKTLKKLLPNTNLDSIIEDFKQQCDFSSESQSFQKEIAVEKRTPFSFLKKEFLQERKWYLLVIFIIAMSAASVKLLTFKGEKELKVAHTITKQLESPIRSDFILPSTSTLLNRPDLIGQIDDKFKKQGNGIQTVALIGIGGAGKTTLAREYALSQKETVIWEMNAETHASLMESFENLAYALSLTEEDRGLLRELTEIKKPSEREKKIVEFVKDRLKLHPNWFLIYDNVEKFGDIQKHFPLYSETWGQGRVILTMRDSTIQNHKQVDQVIVVGDMDKTQKLNLFTQIMGNGENDRLTPEQLEKTIGFLEKIPPFPLDVSVAAYYLKTTNVSYSRYLDLLNQQDKSFTAIQESLLKEGGEYTKTRYNIIALSLKKIINTHEDFADLLLLISLIDSQNIPKELLEKYKDSSIVDNFIYNTRKHSLITSQSSPFSLEASISIHRSTQNIMLDYLMKILNIKENHLLIQKIVNSIENYVDQILDREELFKAKQFISHLEILLTHNYLLTDSTKGRIEGDLGYIYTSLGICKTAIYFFENALIRLTKDQYNNFDKIAQIFLIQGKIYNILADLKRSEDCIKKSLQIYKTHMPENISKISLGLAYLGNVCKWRGELEKAKKFYQESLTLYDKIPPQNCTGKAMTLIYLGEVYRKLGDYNKAKDVTERGFEFSRKYLPKGSVRQASANTRLGIIYREMGNYDRSAELINEGLSLTERNYSKTNIYYSYCMIELAKTNCDQGKYFEAIALAENAIQIYKKSNENFNVTAIGAFECIGNAYKGLGNYEKAIDYLNKTLMFFEKYYGKNHIETAPLLESLGQVYLLNNNLNLAERYLNESLIIFQQSKNSNEYKSLESFSNLHLKRYDEASYNKSSIEAQIFKDKAINDLKKALEIVKINFPGDSLHNARIQTKIKQLEMGKN